MAGKVKGLTIQFKGETTQLDRALKRIGSESKAVDDELRQINRSLRFNGNNVELMRQKFQVLGQKVDITENQLKQFKQAENQLKAQGVSKQSPEWMKLRRNIIETESKLKHFKAEMNKLKFASLSALGNQMKSVGAGFRTAGMYAGIGGAAMVMTGKKLLEYNTIQQQAENKLIEIYKTRMGVSKAAAKETMNLASALQQQGVIGDEVTLSGAQQLATFAKYPSTINKLLPAMDNLLVQQKGYNASADDAKNIANLLGKAMQGQTGALKRVGISFTDAQADILKYGTEEERAAVLAQVITDNVGNMNAVFAQTDEGKIQQIKNSLGDVAERLGAVLLPALAQAATWLSTTVMPKVEQLVSYIEAHPILAKIAVGLTGLLVAGAPLLIFIGALISAIGTIMTSLGGLTSALSFLVSPVGLVIAAIAAAIAIGILLYKNWDTIKAWAIKTWTAISTAITTRVQQVKNKVLSIFNTLRGAVVGIWNGLKSAAASAFNAVKNAITNPIQTALSIIRGIINKIKGLFSFKVGHPHIPLPHFSISPKGWKLGDLLKGKIPSLGIKWYAEGGIFDSPTVIGLGEGTSSEAVIPLDPFWKKLDKIAEGAGGDTIINVYPSDGMNVDELVAKIERMIIQKENRRRMAYGGNR